MAGTDRHGRPTHRPAEVAPKTSFGVDAPSIVILFVGLTVALAFVGIFVGSAVGALGGVPFWLSSLCFAATAAAMFHSSLRGKALLWTEMLEQLALRGDEDALDAGCGRGLVLVSVAQRLPTGHATGVDLWRNRDQSGNARAMTELNADIAGVADRVTVVDGDLRRLPLPDAAFDLVTASFAIHNLSSSDDRALAVRELVRVTRPGGRIVILDIAKTADMVAELQARGLVEIVRSGRRWSTYPPARFVTASCPANPGSSADSRR